MDTTAGETARTSCGIDVPEASSSAPGRELPCSIVTVAPGDDEPFVM